MNDFKAFAKKVRFENRPFFVPDQPIWIGRAPGRLDVMGGIADYSGSLVLEMPIAEVTYTAVQPNSSNTINILSFRNGRSQPSSRFTMLLSALQTYPTSQEASRFFKQKEEDAWAAYIVGVLWILAQEKGIQFSQGLNILIDSTVPEGKGVSSSAAVEVATMQAIANAINIALEPTELAILCQQVENEIAGAPCGIMDQMTVVNGRKEHLLALLCQPATIQGHVKIPSELSFWGIDSGIRHAVSGSDYGSVRIGAFMGLKILQTVTGQHWDNYLVNISPSQFEQELRAHLPLEMKGSDFLRQFGNYPDTVTSVDPEKTYAVQQPTAHPIFEHFRVQTFHRLLTGGVKNGRLLGELMYQSHASYSACGLGSDGTDQIVALVRQASLESVLFGAKISGGGSGGTVVVLGKSDAHEAVSTIVDQYATMTGIQPKLFHGSSDGAHVFKDGVG